MRVSKREHAAPPPPPPRTSTARGSGVCCLFVAFNHCSGHFVKPVAFHAFHRARGAGSRGFPQPAQHPTPDMAPANGVAKRQKTAEGGSVLHYFRAPGFAEPMVKKLNLNITKALPFVEAVDTEFCFNVQLSGADALEDRDTEVRELGRRRTTRGWPATRWQLKYLHEHSARGPQAPSACGQGRREDPPALSWSQHFPTPPSHSRTTAPPLDPARDLRARADAPGRQFPRGRAGAEEGGLGGPDLRGRAPAHLLHCLLLQCGAWD